MAKTHNADGARLEVHLAQSAPIPLAANLSCKAGELLALVGPSGAGKSTVLRAIAGLVRPRTGKITCNGATWFDSQSNIWLKPQDRRVGLVFQDYALFPHLSALHNVTAALTHQPAAARDARARELLAMVNLSGLEGRRPRALSGGQRQRVALARALARDPSALLLDEPFSAVDQMTRERLKRELANLRANLNVPIVLVTHDLDEAVALADRMSVLSRGRTLQDGTPDEVRLHPLSATVARLVGQTNIFEGALLRAASDETPGLIRWRDHELEVASTGAHQVGDALSWMIPSEHVVLHRRHRPSLGERENPVSGQIGDMVVLGDQTALTVMLPTHADASLNFKLATHSARRNGLAQGVDVTVSLLAEGIHLMAVER